MQSAQFNLHAEIEEQHWWFVARRRILQRLVNRILSPASTHVNATFESAPRNAPVSPADDRLRPLVVDVGCGTGANLAAMAREYRCIGIDTSADAIALARRRFPAIEFRQGIAPEGLSDAIGTADLVMLTDVLEHVPDDFALLSRLLVTLKPGAHMLLTVPADLSLWSQHDVSFGHYRRYDRDRFEMLWRDLPATTRLLSHYNARLYPIVKTARMICRWRRRSLGAAGTDFALPLAPINGLLTKTMAGESDRLAQMLDSRARPYSRGVSLIAVLRREAGRMAVRYKPEFAGADFYDPSAPVKDLAAVL